VIPELNKALEPAQNSWSSWLKPLRLVLGGAAVVLGVFSNPLIPVALGVAALTVGKEAAIGGLEVYKDWKQGRTQNGLHYLLRFTISPTRSMMLDSGCSFRAQRPAQPKNPRVIFCASLG